MVEVWLPYGNVEVAVRVPDEQLAGIIEPQAAAADIATTLDSAFASPLGSPPLSDLLRKKSRVAIFIEEFLLRGKSAPLVTASLERLEAMGLNKDAAHLVIAMDPGHQPRTQSIQLAGLRAEVHHHLHSETARADLKSMRLTLNKHFVESDLRIVISEVRPEFGVFEGVERVILRGLAGMDSAWAGYPPARGEKALTLQDIHGAFPDIYSVEFICDSRRNVAAVFTGGLEASAKALDEARRLRSITLERKVDILVASAGGEPFDTDLYSTARLIGNATGILGREGVLVFVAECRAGYGHARFADYMRKFKTGKDLEEELSKRFDPMGRAALELLRCLEGRKIYLASVLPHVYASGTFRLTPARTADAGLQSALRVAGRDARIAVVPSSATTVVKLMAN